MPNALTLETMSPGLLKVGETRSPEPHRRKSRMREIRLSGSGEGPSWATARPTPQRPLLPLTPPCRPRPAVGREAAGGGAVRMAEETDTMLQPTQGGGREGGCNASYKRS